MNFLSKRFLGLAALVLISLLFMMWLAGLLHFGKIAPGTAALPGKAPAGELLVVQETSIPQELSVLGQVISPALAQVAAQVPGRVSRTHVEAGDRVKAGDPLVTLSAQEFQARAARAQAQLTQAGADYRRYQALLKEGAVSPQEFGAMEARYKSAQAQAQEAAAFSGYTVVKAPRAGVVGERRVNAGDPAQPGVPLVVLYDPECLQIEGEVNDSYRASLKIGQRIEAAVPAAGWRGEAALAEIFPLSQPGSRTFKVRTGNISHLGLVPGMFARLTLTLGETRGILIPLKAVHRVGQLTLVEVLADGQATRRQVQLGRTVGDRVEVLAGIKTGEKILLPRH